MDSTLVKLGTAANIAFLTFGHPSRGWKLFLGGTALLYVLILSEPQK